MNWKCWHSSSPKIALIKWMQFTRLICIYYWKVIKLGKFYRFLACNYLIQTVSILSISILLMRISKQSFMSSYTNNFQCKLNETLFYPFNVSVVEIIILLMIQFNMNCASINSDWMCAIQSKNAIMMNFCLSVNN